MTARRSSVDVRVVELITADGIRYDIRPFMLTLALYESMNTLYVTGHIVVLDASNLANIMPLTGYETLNLVLGPADVDDDSHFDETYSITGIASRHITSHSDEVYVLDFASRYYNDFIHSRISKSYSAITIDEALKDLYDTITVNTTETFGQYDLIIPNISKEQAGIFLSMYAVNLDGVNNYLLFGNRHGINLVALDVLCDQDAIIPIYHAHENLDDFRDYPGVEILPHFPANFEKAPFNALSEGYDKFMASKHFSGGTFNSRLYLLNPFKMTHDLIDYNLDFSSYGGENTRAPVPDRIPDDIIDQYGKCYVHTTNRDVDQKDLQPDKWAVSKRITENILNDNWQGIVSTTGNLDVSAGDKVWFDRRVANPFVSESDDITDSQLAGEYLVISVGHYVNKVIAQTRSSYMLVRI